MSRTVTITLTEEEARRIDAGLSDLLCWHRGYAAGRGDAFGDSSPIGVESARRIRERLNDALFKDPDHG